MIENSLTVGIAVRCEPRDGATATRLSFTCLNIDPITFQRKQTVTFIFCLSSKLLTFCRNASRAVTSPTLASNPLQTATQLLTGDNN